MYDTRPTEVVRGAGGVVKNTKKGKQDSTKKRAEPKRKRKRRTGVLPQQSGGRSEGRWQKPRWRWGSRRLLVHVRFCCSKQQAAAGAPSSSALPGRISALGRFWNKPVAGGGSYVARVDALELIVIGAAQMGGALPARAAALEQYIGL